MKETDTKLNFVSGKVKFSKNMQFISEKSEDYNLTKNIHTLAEFAR